MTRFTSVLLVAWLSLTACSGYQVITPERSITAPAAPLPLAMTVGIRSGNHQLQGGFMDLTPAFVDALTQSNLFAAALYPIRSDDKVDAILDVSFAAKFQPDDWLFPKAMFTGLFLYLPAPFVKYEHHYTASGTLRLAAPGGRQLKTYEARTDIPVRVKLNAPPGQVEAEGTKAASADLIQQLVDALHRDRAYVGQIAASAPK